MKALRRRVLEWEALEARALLIGFYEGPSPVPLQVYLRGTGQGSATVHSGAGTTYHVSAAGKLAPFGRTSITGTVRVVGDVEQGTLTLNSARSNLTLHFSGAVPAGPAPATVPFVFQIAEGKDVPPDTTFSFIREQGAGTVQALFSPGPRPGRDVLSLVFSSP
jgi:hypothetical protein